MKRKIQKGKREVENSESNRVSSAVILGIAILIIVIFGVFGYKIAEPKKMKKADTEYSKMMVGKLFETNFLNSVDIINQMKKKGFDVKLDYDNAKIEVDYAHGNSEKIIFSKKRKDGVISIKDAKSEQRDKAIICGMGGVMTDLTILLIIIESPSKEGKKKKKKKNVIKE